MLRIFLSILILTISACEQSAEERNEYRRKNMERVERKEYNVIEEYVRTPLDKANGVNDIQNKRNQQLQDSLNNLE